MRSRDSTGMGLEITQRCWPCNRYEQSEVHRANALLSGPPGVRCRDLSLGARPQVGAYSVRPRRVDDRQRPAPGLDSRHRSDWRRVSLDRHHGRPGAVRRRQFHGVQLRKYAGLGPGRNHCRGPGPRRRPVDRDRGGRSAAASEWQVHAAAAVSDLPSDSVRVLKLDSKGVPGSARMGDSPGTIRENSPRFFGGGAKPMCTVGSSIRRARSGSAPTAA